MKGDEFPCAELFDNRRQNEAMAVANTKYDDIQKVLFKKSGSVIEKRANPGVF